MDKLFGSKDWETQWYTMERGLQYSAPDFCILSSLIWKGWNGHENWSLVGALHSHEEGSELQDCAMYVSPSLMRANTLRMRKHRWAGQRPWMHDLYGGPFAFKVSTDHNQDYFFFETLRLGSKRTFDWSRLLEVLPYTSSITISIYRITNRERVI